MEFETTISKSIRTVDDSARYDAACRRLLSEKTILAWIVKSCVEEFRDCDINDIASRYIEVEPQVSGTQGETNTAAAEETIIYDMHFTVSLPLSGERIRIILSVAEQHDFYPGYPLIKRGIYYCNRMISAQYGPELVADHHGDIKKVASIWICVNPPKGLENTITSYSITEKNQIGAVKEPVENYDLMTAVMICLGRPDSRNENDVLRLLDVIFSSETRAEEKQRVLQRDFNISIMR